MTNAKRPQSTAKHASTSIFFICMGATACTTPQPVAEPTSSPEARHDLPRPADLDALRASFDVPGMALAVITGCKPEDTVLNLGWADLQTKQPVTRDTAFEAASLSKPVFAYLVLQLVDEGLIDLDRPFVEDFRYPRIADLEHYARLTPRLVLSHQTGLPNWVGDTNDPARTDTVPFKSAPGSSYTYSGEAYELLRAYVEFKTQKSLDQLFRARLGSVMPSSTFAPPLAEGIRPARGYVSSADPDSGRDIRFFGGAAGGLVTTATDYARFVALMCQGQGLSPAAHTAMLTAAVETKGGAYPAPTAWGLGWGLMRLGDETIVFHGGNNDEFRSIAGYSLKNRDGFVILTNGRNGADLIDAFLERVN